MTTKKFLAIAAVALMVASSLFVFAFVDDSKASTNDETVKTLDEIKTATEDTYWVNVTVDESTGMYVISPSDAETPTNCIVKVNKDALIEVEGYDPFKIPADCGFTIDSGVTLLSPEGTDFYLSGGKMTVNGVFYTDSGIFYKSKCGSKITVNVNGAFAGPGGELSLVAYNEEIRTRIHFSNIMPQNNACTLEFSNGSEYDIILKCGNDVLTVFAMETYGTKVYVDAEIKHISIASTLSTISLRSNSICHVTALNAGNTFKSISDGHIYIVDSQYNGQIADKDGRVTRGNVYILSHSSGIESSKTIAFVESGKSVNLMDLFGIKLIDGYRITSWTYRTTDQYGEYVTIKDPTNFTSDIPVSISISTSSQPVQKDYTGFFIGAYVLLILAILAPFAVWYIQKKQ